MDPLATRSAQHRRSPSLGSQRAVTLIELMVSIAISLVLLLGLTVLFSSTSQSFRVQDEFARLQENGTAALRYLGDDLRMAGFYGTGTSVASVNLDSLPEITGTDCGAELAGPPARPFALDLSTPIAVEMSLTPDNVSTVFPCIDRANFSPGSPVIVLRGATSHAITQADASGSMSAALEADANYAQTIYVQASPTQEPNTIVFRGDRYAELRAAGLANVRIVNGNQDAPIFEYQTHVYYVRPCSRPTGVGTSDSATRVCQETDDGGHPIPTLVRQELVNQQMQELPLVEGIERLNLSYGLDVDGDGIPDQYTEAPAPGDWPQIIAVRIAVLVRSTVPVAGQDDSGKTYDLGGGVTFTCNTDCSYLRQVYSQTVQLRNCALRRSAGGQQC